MTTLPELYSRADALELATLVQSGAIHARELVQEAIRRIELRNPVLNAVLEKRFDLALGEAEETGSRQGLFSGVPFLTKDLSNLVAGLPHHRGSRFYGGLIPERDSTAVKAYRESGMIILGSTTTPEIGLSPVTEPEAFGACRNPWSLDHTPGGSSGGSAAAVAARIVPCAGASDGGGSIRGPASCCGLFGLKPSAGRVPSGPRYGGGWHGATACHVLTRSVRDSAALLDVSAGTEEMELPGLRSPLPPPPKEGWLKACEAPPRSLRIALWTEAFHDTPVHPDCIHAAEKTARLCEELGHHVEIARPPIQGWEVLTHFMTALMGTVASELRQQIIQHGRKPFFDEIEVPTQLAALMGEVFTAGDMSYAMDFLKSWPCELNDFFSRHDMLITPVTAKPPVRIGEMKEQGLDALAHKTIARLRFGHALKWADALHQSTEKAWAFYAFTPYWNITGQPAMSLPLHWTKDGLPIGTQVIGRIGDEARLFALARQIEQAHPWSHRLPPILGTGD